MDRKPCDECRRVFRATSWDTPTERERKRSGPPCATCRPETFPANVLACEIYLRCADQLIISPTGGAIGINMLAVERLMDLKGVRNQDETMEKVQLLSGVIFREQAKAAEERRDKNRR